MKKSAIIIFILLFLDVSQPLLAFAGPSSTNYELKSYGFGAGGSDNTGLSSANYKVHGTLGESDSASASSNSYGVLGGLTFGINANIPPAPTLTNPGTNYDRLKIVINTPTTQNQTDGTTYAIAISTDNFATDTRYVKSDGTVGTTLAASDFQTYSGWGGASGTFITTLLASTTYSVKAKAKKGNFSETQWGAVSSAVATSQPSLTFSVDASSISIGGLNSGNSYTDSSKTTTLTTSTNAYNGYVVNGRSTGALTNQAYPSYTIADYASPNSAPTTWSGTGFGYTTNDSSLTGGTADRFTNGGPKYAGFTTSSPGDPVADHAGPVTSAISNEQFIITYRVTGDNTTKAGRYMTSVLFIVVPEY